VPRHAPFPVPAVLALDQIQVPASPLCAW